MKKSIASIGFDFSHDSVDNIEIYSKKSLLDYDIVIFFPMLPYVYTLDTYRNKVSYDANASTRLMEQQNHWHSQIEDFLKSGKTLFVILGEKEEVYYDTGKRTYSGTGRNRHTTINVNLTSNYDFLPFSMGVLKPATGKRISLKGKNEAVQEVWNAVKEYSSYKVYFDDPTFEPILVTSNGNRAAGGIYKKDSHIIFIPFIDDGDGRFLEISEDGPDDEYVYTEEGTIFFQNFLSAIIVADGLLSSENFEEPAPDWVDHPDYCLASEGQIKLDIQKHKKRAEAEISKATALEEHLKNETVLKDLLFAKGKKLERATIEAFATLGFKAENYTDESSEFDAILESTEGRFLVEVEGKDEKPIGVSKYQQLERNIGEDFNRENVTTIAHGILVGNAKRKLPPAERGDFFTEKVKQSAKRTGVSLVRSTDLFHAAAHVKNGASADFAEACRVAIVEGSGTTVAFPEYPES